MRRSTIGIRCPHCGSRMRTRTSREVTKCFRDMQVQCDNMECGATFGASLELTHMISPSAHPNPNVMLRSAPPRRIAANIAANDQLESGPEVPPADLAAAGR